MISLILEEKEKGKTWIALGWNRPKTAHAQEKRARARAPALASLHKDPRCFEQPLKSLQHYCFVSLTFASRSLPFFLFTTLGPRRQMATGQAPTNLYRPRYAMTGALKWLTPNSTPNNHFPSINCMVRALTHTAHGDSASNGQTEKFLVILQVLA